MKHSDVHAIANWTKYAAEKAKIQDKGLFDTNSPSTFHVIGNVWDNPELLPEYVPELLTEATT